MLYIEYERLKKQYYETQKHFQKVLDKKEMLFQRTQPHSVAYDHDRVSGGAFRNSFDSYIIEMDKIREELDTAESILYQRLQLIKAKEAELRLSKNVEDIIYCLRFLERLKISEIAIKTCYSESSIHRFVRIIKDNIKDDRK